MRRFKRAFLIVLILLFATKKGYAYFDDKIDKQDTNMDDYVSDVFVFKTSPLCELDKEEFTHSEKDYTVEEMRQKVRDEKKIILSTKKNDTEHTLLEVPEHKNPNFYLDSDHSKAVIRKEFNAKGPNMIAMYNDDETPKKIEGIKIDDGSSKVLYKIVDSVEFKCNTFNEPIFSESERSINDILLSDEDVLLFQYGNVIYKGYKVNIDKI